MSMGCCLASPKWDLGKLQTRSDASLRMQHLIKVYTVCIFTSQPLCFWCNCYAKMSHLMTKPTKWLHSAKTQISLGIHPVWSESSQCTQWVAEGPMFLHADREDSDQTGQIWVFPGRTVILLVLSWGSSNVSNFRITLWMAFITLL